MPSEYQGQLCCASQAELEMDSGDIENLREHLCEISGALFPLTGSANKMSESLKLQECSSYMRWNLTQSVIFESV